MTQVFSSRPDAVQTECQQNQRLLRWLNITVAVSHRSHSPDWCQLDTDPNKLFGDLQLRNSFFGECHFKTQRFHCQWQTFSLHLVVPSVVNWIVNSGLTQHFQIWNVQTDEALHRHIWNVTCFIHPQLSVCTVTLFTLPAVHIKVDYII